MEIIIFHPEELWEYFEEHMDELRNDEVVVARNSALGTTISIYVPVGGGLTIAAAEDDVPVGEVTVNNGADCRIKAQAFYDKYLNVDYASVVFPDEMEQTDKEDEEIEEREGELNGVVDELLWTVLDKSDYEKLEDSDRENILDHFCEYLYKTYDFDIYRPMRLEDEDGNDFFVEYPYDHMEFEDE